LIEIKYSERAAMGPPKTYTRTATVKFPVKEMMDITSDTSMSGRLDLPSIHIDAILEKAANFVSGEAKS